MIFLEERIGKLIENIAQLIYPQTTPIPTYRMCKTIERFENIAQLDTGGWEMLTDDQLWGGHREYYWFDTTVEIPAGYAGACVVYEMLTGRESGWDATNPQFTIYLDGVLTQGLDVNHREVLLTEQAEAGRKYRITLSAFTGDQNFSLQLKSSLKILDRITEKYYYDLNVPYQVARLLDNQDKAYIDIIQAANESLNQLDLRRPYSAAYYETLAVAGESMQREFYRKYCGPADLSVYCIGHTHIDVAWLWTLAVTEDKAVRSFSTVLALMDQYPEYLFMSSQAQLYKYVQAKAPQVYERIKERVREGRWEPEGSMYVEADCNIASGESLVRQILVGKRFFRQEFGVDNKILWLPDVFGYSAAMPQIMQKSGVPYFMTTKISWNETNKMPYDTFAWEGIDGSKVLTHFIPARDYNDPGQKGSFQTGHFTTYNGYLNPSQIKGGWQRYQQKHLNQEVLMSFGFGDGGGGPTKDMLENQRRLTQGIPGCPQTRMSTARDFFETLDQHVRDNKYLPTWSGELYLEYHRGTYTSMARNKKYNRQSEFAWQNLEWLSALNGLINHGEYPSGLLASGWEIILRNQFHDILPGSSIKEVYEDSKIEYENLLKTGREQISLAQEAITQAVEAADNSLVVFNPNGFLSSDLVFFDTPADIGQPVVRDQDVLLPCQKGTDGRFVFRARQVPAKGYKTFSLHNAATQQQDPLIIQAAKQDEKLEKPGLIISAGRLANAFYDIRLNEQGQFTSLLDRRANREVLQPGSRGNVLMTYEDKPHNYDAWDINNYYVEKSWEIDDVQKIEILEQGPLVGRLRITRHYLDSIIIQTISLYSDSPRIDIRNEIDWKEKQILVKVLFPVDIHALEATFDIQYGNVKRATHTNTSWDFARFEVCMHKWLDVSEDGYGVSLLNDSKYGCSVHQGLIGLSLLKSAIYPNPDADKEHHDFVFSLLPHQGDWRQGETERQAMMLNNPLTVCIKTNRTGILPPAFSYVTCDQSGVMLDVVKKAEDSDDWIVRFHEYFNRRSQATLTFGRPVVRVVECDLMENNLQTLDTDGQQICVAIKPYEIRTIKVSFA